MLGSSRGRAVWLVVAAWGAGQLALAEGSPTHPLVASLAERVEATQVTVDRALGDGRANFRATTIRVEEGRLVLLTAAHCLIGVKPGDDFRIGRGKLGWRGKVSVVTLNPAFRPNENAGPGPDTAVVFLEIPGGQAGWAEAAMTLGTAELTEGPGARRSGEAVSVLVVDQDGAPRVMKAGNFRNPRWLEWGKKYVPRHGDSGSGIFVAQPGGGGDQVRLVLIGTVSVVDSEGGGGSLIWREEPWVSDSLGEKGQTGRSVSPDKIKK